MNQNDMFRLVPVYMYGLFFGIVIFLSMNGPLGIPAFSFENIINPFLGEKGNIGIALFAVSIIEVVILDKLFLPEALKDQKKEMVVIGLAEMPGLLGFVFCFLIRNPWPFLAFAVIGLCNYAYVLMKLRNESQRTE
ncbi:hypothetical protein HY990_02335 [Candidatus Micrarchaeota archaeon]|nr:hypothetical protein [Candidatus Micrarchaeota archaeon]